ncbi:hypothetical protein ElyMa_005790400 [Elysia marginata]|uniref:Uncharacterized protein n=1 Tax=Elysia marginata TaxID=1093978 RepID=A0AAV4FS17_9GAST|nr:hypothetical protein ElyMa_005790400 [Elysia marginata]
MELFIINVQEQSKPCTLVMELFDALDGLEGITVHTQLPIHPPGRKRAVDYDTCVAFSGPTQGCFKLGEEAMYICKQYRAVKYVHDSSEFYAIYSATHDTCGAWNIVRQLLPAPEELFNCPTRRLVDSQTTRGTLFVDTSKKAALLDAADLSDNGVLRVARR